MEISKGKLPLLHKCSVPNRAMLFSLYNHSLRLWGGVDGTSINTLNLILHMNVGEKREASIKWGVGGNLQDRLTITTQDVLKKLLGLCRGPTFFDKFSSSLLDCHEHHINCYPRTKT